jgi:hypothetical protein
MEVKKGGPERTRAEAGKAVNDMLLINALHFDKGDDGIVEVDDLEECALAAILKAMANYVVLSGKKEDWVQAFFFWIKQNLDPKKYNVDCDPNWVEPKPEAWRHIQKGTFFSFDRVRCLMRSRRSNGDETVIAIGD